MMQFANSRIQVSPNGPLTADAVNRLKQIKDRTGLSYAVLGSKVGLSGTFLYNLINKGRNVGTQHVQRMAEAIDRLEDPTHAHSDSQATEAVMLAHSYHLRPGLQVSFDLPSDLTEKEADRLTLFIRSLPTA